jgi:hypothetical protein
MILKYIIVPMYVGCLIGILLYFLKYCQCLNPLGYLPQIKHYVLPLKNPVNIVKEVPPIKTFIDITQKEFKYL